MKKCIFITLIIVSFMSCNSKRKVDEISNSYNETPNMTSNTCNQLDSDKCIISDNDRDSEDIGYCTIRIGDNYNIVINKLSSNMKEYNYGIDSAGLKQILTETNNDDKNSFLMYFYEDKLFQVTISNVILYDCTKFIPAEIMKEVVKMNSWEFKEFADKNIEVLVNREVENFTIVKRDVNYIDKVNSLYSAIQ